MRSENSCIFRSYSKWIPGRGPPRDIVETVDRYMAFMKENLGSKSSPKKEYAELARGDREDSR